jgi:amidase
MPIRVVANGVVSRSVRDTAAFYAEAERIWPATKLPPIGHVRHAGTRRLRIAVVTHSLLRESSPEVRELTMKSAALLEELGHRVDHLEKPPVPQSFVSDFVLYWGLLAMGQIQQNKRAFDEFDVSRLDNLSRGLDRHARRNLHRIPLALLRLARTRRYTARLTRTYDLVMTPTLADETPQIGYLDPMADFEQIIDRLQNWVAFTPLHNVTGEPAISLPLALSANGLPVGMMFSAPIGHEARLLELAYELEDARPWARIDEQV